MTKTAINWQAPSRELEIAVAEARMRWTDKALRLKIDYALEMLAIGNLSDTDGHSLRTFIDEHQDYLNERHAT